VKADVRRSLSAIWESHSIPAALWTKRHSRLQQPVQLARGGGTLSGMSAA